MKKKITQKEKRTIKAEGNPFKELLKVIRHFLKDFINELRDIDNPRHGSFTREFYTCNYIKPL